MKIFVEENLEFYGKNKKLFNQNFNEKKFWGRDLIVKKLMLF